MNRTLNFTYKGLALAQNDSSNRSAMHDLKI